MGHERGEAVRWQFPVMILFGGFVVYLLRSVLIPFAVAFMLAYVFTPVVNRMQRHLRIPRIIAVILLFLILAFPLVLLYLYNGPVLVQNVRYLAENAPEQVTRFLTNLLGAQQVSFLGQTLDVREVAPSLVAKMQALLGAPLDVAQLAWSIIDVIMNAIFTIVIFFYFLTGGKGLINGVIRLAPPEHRDRFQGFIPKFYS